MQRISAFAFLAGLAVATPVSAAELAIVGTGDGIELLRSVSAVFNADHPDVVTTVPPSIGSGGAVAAVGAERNALGRVARALTDAERAQGLVSVPLVKIPSAFFAHGGVGVRGLTAEQIAGIFEGRITNWSEVGGADLKIKVVRREETDSTLTVLRASMPGWKELALTPSSKLATTTQDAIETVRRVPGAVGFGPYLPALDEEVAVLAVGGQRPTDADYPSAVTLSLIYKTGNYDESAKSFVAFAQSARARNALVGGGGVPMTR